MLGMGLGETSRAWEGNGGKRLLRLMSQGLLVSTLHGGDDKPCAKTHARAACPFECRP